MLAAGVGRRLGDASLPPKVLLRFGGKTLLERHAAILRHCGIERVDLIVGYRSAGRLRLFSLHHQQEAQALVLRDPARDRSRLGPAKTAQSRSTADPTTSPAFRRCSATFACSSSKLVVTGRMGISAATASSSSPSWRVFDVTLVSVRS